MTIFRIFLLMFLITPLAYGMNHSAPAFEKDSISKSRGQCPWHTKTYQLLYESVANYRTQAIKNEDLEALEKLFQSGVEIDALAEATNYRSALHEAVLEGKVKVIKFLLNHGADINLQDGLSWTPLHLAAIDNRPAMAKFLVVMGARPDITDQMGNTPLDSARDCNNTGVFLSLLGVSRVNPGSITASSFEQITREAA